MTTEIAPVRQVLDEARALTIPALRRAVDELPERLRHQAGYHLGWWDENGRTSEADSGKTLRPALVLASARAVGSTAAAAVPAAAAVELVHNFSLVHDDVMDGDATRRHRPTVWKAFGIGPAILLGDALLALAFQTLERLPRQYSEAAVQILTRAVADLLDGQSDDLAFERRTEVSPAECLAMARKKTGALLAGSAALGALSGGGAPAQVTQLHTFGADLGLAFQCADDLLGIWGDPAVTGKPAYSDLLSRKKSLPVVAAMASGTPAGDWLLRAYQGEELDVEEAAAAVELAGGRAWCQAQADTLIERARQNLRSGVPLARIEELDALAGLVARRDR